MIHPEVTLYGWQNVKIIELTDFFSDFFFLNCFFWACSADVAASGSVISLKIVNRW